MAGKTDWKEKIEAYLHDPPHKPYGIANHRKTVASNRLAFGLDPSEEAGFDHAVDAVAAAADRFVFPNPRMTWHGEPLRTDWRAEGTPFIHPFGGKQLKASVFPRTREVAEDWMASALNGIVSGATQQDFIRAWRLWPERLASEDRAGAQLYMPYLVADTRIPDHTVWQHNALVAALQACRGEPAFMIFQIGPVQSFIRQARKTIDLWAGSYLLSYLVAHAMETVIREYGPDHLIFPQVRGNALIDYLLRDILGDALDLSEAGLDKRMRGEMLLPTLPNRFLALIPAGDGKIAEACCSAVRDKWNDICKDVHDFINSRMGDSFPDWDELWESPKSRFPRCEYHVQPLLDPGEALQRLREGCPPYGRDVCKHPVALLEHWAEHCVGCEDRTYIDPRNYRHRWDHVNRRAVMTTQDGEELTEDAAPSIVNPGYAWPISYMTAEWTFGAVRAARAFEQTEAFGVGQEKRRKFEIPKDQLDGEFEVLGGSENWEDFWRAVAADETLGTGGEFPQRHFPKGNQRFGLLTVVKRLFAKAHLEKAFGFDVHRELGTRITSTYEIATGRKINLAEDDEEARTAEAGDNYYYYAVVALDGDHMGRWLSGENAPPLHEHLSGKGVRQFFKDCWQPPRGLETAAEDVPRTLTPSYHAALSEALANFASYCVAPVIDEFDGQLVYAGGDDVLAMVPATKALDCAEALQMVFRGLKPEGTEAPVKRALDAVFDYDWSEMHKADYPEGFLKLRKSGGGRPTWPMLMPGPRMTVSAGIAVGHVKAPMQDLIQAARDAEATAKQAGRNGFCVRIMKRSGETHSFTAHWPGRSKSIATGAEQPDLLAVIRECRALRNYDILSHAFAHKYCQYIAPMLRGHGKKHWRSSFDVHAVAGVEEILRLVLERQGGRPREDAQQIARRMIEHFRLDSGAVSPAMFMNFWMSLAFIHRLDDRSQRGGESQ